MRTQITPQTVTIMKDNLRFWKGQPAGFPKEGVVNLSENKRFLDRSGAILNVLEIAPTISACLIPTCPLSSTSIQTRGWS